ncbi:MAG: hypothetical protein JXA78_16485 [Anaerolineales bacterium]|nr:hypothetical protein [Anaerolineales bacterium]
MSQQISLKEAERRVFTSTFQDGLWDVFLGCFPLQFAIAPLLSTFMGDFWSSAVFLPFWGLVYLAIWLLRRHLVAPRAGVVKFGPERIKRLRKFSLVMLVANVTVFLLGILVVLNFSALPGKIYPILFGSFMLAGFSLAAYFLDFSRLYIYGLLIALSPLVGEWLYTFHGAAHHGFPITFGFTSIVMILTGLAVFVRFLRGNPVPAFEEA